MQHTEGAQQAGGTILTWVEKHGLATVLVLILLAYGLWGNYQLQTTVAVNQERILVAQARLAESQERMTTLLAQTATDIATIRSALGVQR